MMNMMTAYDVEGNVSLASRFFEGDELDKKAILDFVRFFEFENALIIVDTGLAFVSVVDQIRKRV